MAAINIKQRIDASRLVMETKITNAIKNFEEESGLTVKDIEIQRSSVVDTKNNAQANTISKILFKVDI